MLSHTQDDPKRWVVDRTCVLTINLTAPHILPCRSQHHLPLVWYAIQSILTRSNHFNEIATLTRPRANAPYLSLISPIDVTTTTIILRAPKDLQSPALLTSTARHPNNFSWRYARSRSWTGPCIYSSRQEAGSQLYLMSCQPIETEDARQV